MPLTVFINCWMAWPGLRTVTLNEPVTLFPALSVTVQITVLVPNENVEHDGGEHVGDTGPPSSDAATVYTIKAPAVLVGNAVMSAGIVNFGGVSIFTVIEVVAVFPLISVTVAAIVCVPKVRYGVRNDHEIITVAGFGVPPSILT